MTKKKTSPILGSEQALYLKVVISNSEVSQIGFEQDLNQV